MAETMQAGRELDALVAERVMGATIHEGLFYDYMTLPGERPISDQRPVPFYSADIAAAWQVVEKIGLLDSRYSYGLDSGLTLQRNASGEWEVRYREGSAVARADTAPLAICRAALACLASPQGTAGGAE